jgi:hypothetical protein
VANQDVRISSAAATVEGPGIVASFRLEGGLIDAQWQGAFSRSMEGSLAGMARRWHLVGPTVVVNEVEPGRGADVAAAVQTAVASANDYVAQQAEAAEVDRTSRAEALGDLERAAVEAQRAMQAQLRL